MKKFPDAIHPPKAVAHARTKRKNEVVRSAGIGVAIRLFVVTFEFIGSYLFSSSALFLDALSSLLDVATSLIFIICVRYAAKPPDANHPFGHGRFEPLVGLQMGLLLIVLGGFMFFQQLSQVVAEPQASINGYAWLFPFAALILLEISYRIVTYYAKKHDSPALAADAVHYRVDSLTSLMAAAALFIGLFVPEWSHRLDHFGALLIAAVMVVFGINAARTNIHQLLDRVPSKEYFKLVKEAAESIEGVKGTEKTRIQQYGPDAHIDIDIEVDPKMSVDKAHQISQKVRAEIQQRWPAVRDVTVHIEPFYPGDH
jgi:cation diffusion facilitator family transporter